MIFRPSHCFETGCAAHLFGCGGLGKCAVVDAHERDIDEYVEALLDVPPTPAEMERILRFNQGRAEVPRS